MVDEKSQSERGQVLVFLVVGVVVFLGFTALAIDGGLILSERRNAQNAADASALAAGLAKINGQNWQQIGYDRARSNGYENVNPAVNVTVNSPPVSGQYQGNAQYIQVLIDSQVNTAFAHFVFGGPLVTSVEAIARAKTSGPLAEGNALVALNPSACEAVDFNGNQTVYIENAGVFSNSAGELPNCPGLIMNGSGDVSVVGGGISVVGDYKKAGGSGSMDPFPPNDEASHMPKDPVDTPKCGEVGSGSVSRSGNTETYTPGNYSNIKVSANNTDVVLQPGLYCIQNDFKVTGGSLYGNDVTIYVISGDFETGGNTMVTLDAPESGSDGQPPSMPGMLIFLAPENNGVIKLTGTSGSSFTGTVYAPDGSIDISGNNTSMVLNSQLIGDTISISGNPYLEIKFNPSQNYPAPPRVDLAK